MKTPILLTGMHRSGGSWVAKMIEGGGGVVHVNEPFNRRHPPGLTPGILHVPPPLAYAATELADPYTGNSEPDWDNTWIDIGGEG